MTTATASCGRHSGEPSFRWQCFCNASTKATLSQTVGLVKPHRTELECPCSSAAPFLQHGCWCTIRLLFHFRLCRSYESTRRRRSLRMLLLLGLLVSCFKRPSLSILAVWLLSVALCCLDARTQPCHHLSYIGLILLRNAIYHKVICLHSGSLQWPVVQDFTAIHHVFAPSELGSL